MPFFDNSTAVYQNNQTPKRIYHSYMCPSKCEYSNKNDEEENAVDKSMWVNPNTIVQDRRVQLNISKLRDILSDTIASLTRENNLKKGESVELTLEIEMMKSYENTPTNSLVEVTIIQHNSKKNKSGKLDKVSNKMLFTIDKDNLVMKEPSLEKQQSWFKRVVSRENIVCRPSRELRNEPRVSRKQLHKPLFCPTANQRYMELGKPESRDVRSNFVNILPEENTRNENVYKKTKRDKQKPVENIPSQAVTEKNNKKGSLMKKISDIFLPPKKSSKVEVVETALSTLKNESGNMKTMKDEKEKHKHSKKRNKSQVQNLGKLVNNILCDVMSSMDGDNKDKTKQDLPLHYHRFFEPLPKTNKKQKKLTRRKTSPSMNKLYRSHSDTCCVGTVKSETETGTGTGTGTGLKSSHSIGDCSSRTLTKTPEEACVGDTNQAQRRRRKRSELRDRSKSHKRTLKSEKRTPKPTMAVDPKESIPSQNPVFSRSSLIQWNGQCLKISKDIKARIEMLIVNELENLALKEGMECDVSPLPSTDDTLKGKSNVAVEKVSSYMCELDISDKNVKKVMKRKKSLTRKVSVHQSPIETCNIETNQNHTGHKGRTHTTMASSGTQTQPILRKPTQIVRTGDEINGGSTGTNKNEINIHSVVPNERNPLPVRPCGAKQDSVEVKYMNKNMQNWSGESQTITVYSPRVMMSNQQTTVCHCLNQRSQSLRSNRFITTGFIKIIRSDDSTWNKSYKQSNIISNIIRSDHTILAQETPETNPITTGQTSTFTGLSSSKLSSDLDSSIEIELDIHDLEYILREAKQNNNANKVLIEAKSVNPYKKRKAMEPVGKNSPSYTNQLLTNAVKKLEKYANAKKKNKKDKY